MVEMIQHIFDSRLTSALHELTHGRKPDHSALLRCGLNDFVRLTTRHARGQRKAIGMCDQNRFFRCRNRIRLVRWPQ